MEPVKRHHLLRRLSKAVRHAEDLVRLTAARCDARSNLEAEAYSAWMSGTMLLEKANDWQGALAAFGRAKKLLEALFQVGDFDQRATCRHFLNQVEPAARYCEYQISRHGGSSANDARLSMLETATSLDGPASDLLASKLASLAAETSSLAVQEGKSTSEVHWNGKTVTIRDERCRIAVHTALELQAQLDQGSHVTKEADQSSSMELEEPLRALYDRIINQYSEARAAARAALQVGQQGEGAEEARIELNELQQSLHGLELQHTIDRNLFLAKQAAKRLKKSYRRQLAARSLSSHNPSSRAQREKGARPEDIARLYDALIVNATELNDLAAEVGGASGEVLMDDCAAEIAHFQAGRCLFAAHSLLVSRQFIEAALLFDRASERCDSALIKYQECQGGQNDDATEHLHEMQRDAEAFKLVALAERRASELQATASTVVGVHSLSLEEEQTVVTGKRSTPRYLEEDLDRWEAFAGGGVDVPRIARIPAPPELVPVRPIVLDAALMCIEPPNLDHRKPKKSAGAAAAGMVSRLFGWGR